MSLIGKRSREVSSAIEFYSFHRPAVRRGFRYAEKLSERRSRGIDAAEMGDPPALPGWQ